MSDGQKISFSFSKLKKSSLVKKVNLEPKEKKEYVDCFDGGKGTFSYKGNVKSEQPGKQELVIPLVSTKTSLDILRSRIEKKSGSNYSKDKESNSVKKSGVKKNESKSLEEIAALEILNELKNSGSGEKDSNKMTINANEIETESSETDIDYDNVPVSDYGMAMLRGMGWKPNTGIGKEPRIVSTVSPKLRPKGLGLGAKPAPETSEEEKAKTK